MIIRTTSWKNAFIETYFELSEDEFVGGLVLFICVRVETIETGVTLVIIAELTGCGEYDVETVLSYLKKKIYIYI